MYSGKPQQYEIDGAASRQMMNLGQMQGMPPDQAYQQRGSMMMTPSIYGHGPANQYVSNFTRTYPRGNPSMHSSAMNMIPNKQVPIGVGAMSQGYMGNSSSTMATPGYIGSGYSSHPHQVPQNPQNLQTLHMGGQGMSNMGGGQSGTMQGYHSGYPASGGTAPYIIRNQPYHHGMTQPMGYPQQHPHLHQPQQQPSIQQQQQSSIQQQQQQQQQQQPSIQQQQQPSIQQQQQPSIQQQQQPSIQQQQQHHLQQLQLQQQQHHHQQQYHHHHHQQQQHQQQQPQRSALSGKRSLEGSLMAVLPTQEIKQESQQQVGMVSGPLPSPITPHTTAGLSRDVALHPPASSNASLSQFNSYSNIPPTPNSASEEKDFVRRRKEITSLFDNFLSQNKELDTELIKRIKTYLPILKSKQLITADIQQECEQLYKQAHSVTETTLTDHPSLPSTNALSFFSENKFPDNRLPPEFTLDIPQNETERFLKFEIEQLDPRLFSVDTYTIPIFGGGCVNITLECQLKREGLPAVPALIVKIPADYPQSSPESDLMDRYDSTPFLLRVKKCLVEEMVSLSGEYTLSHLLNTWERVVRFVCHTM